jgi:hypothetical protein
MEYADEEHTALAEVVYADIGKPTITLQTAWIVFKLMIDRINTNA